MAGVAGVARVPCAWPSGCSRWPRWRRRCCSSGTARELLSHPAGCPCPCSCPGAGPRRGPRCGSPPSARLLRPPGESGPKARCPPEWGTACHEASVPAPSAPEERHNQRASALGNDLARQSWERRTRGPRGPSGHRPEQGDSRPLGACRGSASRWGERGAHPCGAHAGGRRVHAGVRAQPETGTAGGLLDDGDAVRESTKVTDTQKRPPGDRRREIRRVWSGGPAAGCRSCRWCCFRRLRACSAPRAVMKALNAAFLPVPLPCRSASSPLRRSCATRGSHPFRSPGSAEGHRRGRFGSAGRFFPVAGREKHA